MWFAVVVGMLWSCTGIFYGHISRSKLDVYLVWICCALISIAFASLSGITDVPALISGKIPLPSAGYAGFMFGAGMLNLTGSLTLYQALKRGNPGIAWAIGQSALIVPLIALSIWYKEPLQLYKVIGIVFIIGGIIALAGDKNKEGSPVQNTGIMLALLAFCITGGAGTMTSSCGYFSYNDQGNIRTLITLSAYMLTALIWKLCARDFSFKLNRKALGIIGLMALSTCTGIFLQFKGLDHLAAKRAGGVFFPLAIGICVAGFSLYTILVKKEKYSLTAGCGLAAVILGIIVISNVVNMFVH
ncbi:MAG: EamA family transporter [Lentisphaeria bacterium]|nr:EamA family transporter [Lentisphaeria bacterium]